MAEFKKWISYIYAYNGEVKGKNVGFARVEARGDCCRLAIGIKGAYGCDRRGLDIGLYLREKEGLRRVYVGSVRIREGSGEFEEITARDNMFGTGIPLERYIGLWITSEEKETMYIASWEQNCLDIREFLGGKMTEEAPQTPFLDAAERKEQQTQEPSLWDSLCRYYPKTAPQLQSRGIQLLQIRPGDIRYLPRNLWYYSNNSFLLHGYYRYKHLVLAKMTSEKGVTYLLGVPGSRTQRESFSAELFGFHEFLPVHDREGYWMTKIRL